MSTFLSGQYLITEAVAITGFVGDSPMLKRLTIHRQTKILFLSKRCKKKRYQSFILSLIAQAFGKSKNSKGAKQTKTSNTAFIFVLSVFLLNN